MAQRHTYNEYLILQTNWHLHQRNRQVQLIFWIVFRLNLINYLFKAKALEYWSHAAKYGQIDAQIRIADFNARGYNLVLINPELAAMY